jgi:hypothetical protein
MAVMEVLYLHCGMQSMQSLLHVTHALADADMYSLYAAGRACWVALLRGSCLCLASEVGRVSSGLHAAAFCNSAWLRLPALCGAEHTGLQMQPVIQEPLGIIVGV